LDPQAIGKWMAVAGLVVAAVGGAVWLIAKLGVPIGRLPGDLRVEREGVSVAFPIMTCIIASVVLTIVLNLVLRLLRR
jgi:O-antigen/teichoic acid export membrane protein